MQPGPKEYFQVFPAGLVAAAGGNIVPCQAFIIEIREPVQTGGFEIVFQHEYRYAAVSFGWLRRILPDMRRRGGCRFTTSLNLTRKSLAGIVHDKG